jgi:hypothetical protein
MVNYKIVEVKIIWCVCVWSDVNSSYMVSSSPKYRCLCGALDMDDNQYAVFIQM